MIGTLIISIFVFVLLFTIVILATEGLKITFATIIGSFGLSWAYLIIAWSSFKIFVIDPAISVILGSGKLTLYNISATLLFIAWCWIILISLFNIILTMNKGSVKIYQNITESDQDNL